MSRVDSIGIIGAGTMGSALAQKFAQEGLRVRLIDREERFLQRGMEGISVTLQEGVERKIFSPDEKQSIERRIHVATDYSVLRDCQFVIEAVFEDKNVKKEVFALVAKSVAEDAIIATNTSSFSVSELASSVSNPERFIGLHFFYHAAKNRLVEVVCGDKTRTDVFQQTLLFMQRCGKDPITCRDAHGFVVNRFFVPWLNEACRLFEEGIAEKSAIDTVFMKTFGCSMGPFALMNATGIPIAYHSQRTLEYAFGSLYKPAEVLKKQTELGQPWTITESPDVSQETADGIRRRALGIMMLVCGQLLDECVCTAGDINRGARIGLQWRWGPMDLFLRYGENAVQKMARAKTDSEKVSMPKSLRAEYWKQDTIRIDRYDAVGVITINRPEDLNALHPTVTAQLSEAFTSLEIDESIDTIVLTGQGKAFMAGADIKFFIDHIKANTIHEIIRFTKDGQDLYQRIDDSKKRVVAILNGLTLGGGLELALTADIILAIPSAMLAFPETGIGIYPGLGGTQRTVTRIGKGLTKYLIYTGIMVTAQQAYELGLIDALISWDDVPNVLRGNLPSKNKAELSDDARSLRTLFEKYSVEELIDGNVDAGETSRFEKVFKRLRYKAPLALKEAEALIEAQNGPASELDRLDYIFSTHDALTGLMSLGKSESPKFNGS